MKGEEKENVIRGTFKGTGAIGRTNQEFRHNLNQSIQAKQLWKECYMLYRLERIEFWQCQKVAAEA